MLFKFFHKINSGSVATVTGIIFSTLFLFLNTHLSANEGSFGNALDNQQPWSDFKKITERGTLRIIVPTNLSIGIFPRGFISPLDEQQNLAKEFAHSLNLEPELVEIDSYDEMFTALNNGRGDLIVANLVINPEHKQKLSFSVPLEESKEVVLVRKSDTHIEITKDLAGKRLLLSGLPRHWRRAEDFKLRYPSIELVKFNNGVFSEQMLDQIVNKKYDAAIIDNNIAQKYLEYRDDLRIAFNASAQQPRAWGLRKDSNRLKGLLNTFLTNTQLSNHHAEKSYGDLAKIKKRGYLRIILKNNASSYFWQRKKFMGFEYELAQAMAKDLGVKLSVIVPPDNKTVLDWLEQGKADVAAGFLKPGPEWQKRGIISSRPYHQTFQHIVVNNKENTLHSAADLEGKTVVVQKPSSYWNDLQELKNTGIKFNLKAAPEGMEAEEIVQKVASGEFQMTLVDGQVLAIEQANDVGVKSAFTFGDQQSHALAVCAENTRLLAMLNRYIKLEKDGPLYSRLYDKYFTKKRKVALYQKSRIRTIDGKKIISSFDHLVQRYSRKNDLDWRFISAQMFQESHFKPNAVSHAGATGLMQIMPTTGRILGFSELFDPETSIKAGTKYMGQLFRKFDPELPVIDRMWFTLASYNAGIGHVSDARILAETMGLDKNRWFGNVEKAMLLLSEAKYFKKARYGYVRGKEPVGYVRNIKRLYANYANIARLDETTNPEVLSEETLSKKVVATLVDVGKDSTAPTKKDMSKVHAKEEALETYASINMDLISAIETDFIEMLDYESIHNELAALEKDLNKIYSHFEL